MKKKVNKYQKGGGISLPVLYTNNPRKVQAYQDSLNLYNKSKKQLSQIKLNERDTPVYLRKGISPRLILQPEYDFVNYQGYNTSGRFEDNMNPNNSFPAPKIKQTIMPIGGIGVNTGNSMGGWYDIYKKPVQPYKLKKKTKKKPKPPSQQPQPVNVSSVEILQPVPQDMGITPTPQPTGYPVYGPGNSLIGTVTSSGEFTPASYMGINRRDIDLLKNEQQLAQYLQSKGINTPLIKQQYGGATRSDSLNVLNNALRVRDYYNKTGNYTKGPSKRVYGSNVFPSIDEDYNFFLYNNGLQVINYPTRSGTLHEYGRLPVETYRKNIDKNKFYQREGASNILDTRAPMQLYDRRIQPTHEKAYRNINTKDVMYGDSVGIYEYDPLSVTPWDMLKPKQRDERIKKYGVTGTPYKSVKDYEKSKIQNSDRKKIRVKVTRKPNAAFVTQAPVTQDVTLPPPVTQEVVPPSQAPSVQQPVGYPVYGPSRSLIGNVTSSGQFTPTSYLGMNRGDLDLLNNQEQLSQYLRSQGINTPLIKQPLVKQQYGGKISFPTAPTSSDSLNLYNRALEIQKYYDSKKYKKEPLEKSPDEVRADHEKEIQKTLKEEKKTYPNITEEDVRARYKDNHNQRIKDAQDYEKKRKARKFPDYLERLEEARKDYLEPWNYQVKGKLYKPDPGYGDGGYRGGNKIAYRELTPNEKYYIPINENQFGQREMSFGFLDFDSPMPIYDRRIVPQNLVAYEMPDKDRVEIYEYDPLAVKPYELRTPEEKAQWEELYGENRKTPTPQVTNNQRSLSSNSYPVYGPSKSLIGNVTSTGEFIPASYIGVNKADLDLLKNQQQLMQYLTSQGIANPLIKQQYGGISKFQNGGENIIDKARKDAEEYITGWYNSPKYKQRFQESLSPGEEYMIRGRERRLAAIPSIEWVDSGPANYLAKTNPVAERDLQIKLNLAAHTPEALEEQSLAQSGAHELDHIINMGGRYIPKKTRQFISSIRPKSFRETPIYKKEIQPHMKMRKDFFDKILGGSGNWVNQEEVNRILKNRNVQENWFKEPTPDNPSPDFYRALSYKFNYYNPPFKNKTEPVSFWNKIRQDAKELGIYDPYTEDFDKEKFDKFLQIGNTPKTRDFRKLIDWYGDPNIIIEGMNKIVKQDDSENMDMAREGGNVAQYQIGGAIRNAVRSMGSGAKRAAGSIVQDRKEIKITDPRKIRATTGKAINPNKDLVSGVYSTENLKKIVNAAKKNKLSLDDIYTLAAMDLQETGWGRADDNIGHVLHGEGVLPEDRFVNAYLNSINTANRLKFTDPYLRLQVYNGLGRVTPNTEKNYHGFRMQNIYGVPIPAGGISMRENPLYGKQIIDLRDNVLKTNADYINYVNWLYNQKQMGGSIQKYQNGGSWGNTPIMYTTDPRRIQASLDSMNLYNRFNTYIPGPQQGYNPKILSKDIREERKLMEAVKEAFPDYYRTSTPIKPVAIVGTVKNKTKPISRKNFATVRPIFVKPKYRYLKPVAETTTPQASASVVNVQQIPTAVPVQSVPVPNQQPVPVPNEVTDFAIVWADPNENPNSLTQKVKYFKTREEFDEAAKKLGATNISTMGKSAQANLGVRSNIPEFQYGGSKKKKKQTPSLKSSFGKMDVLGAAANAAMDRRRKERIARSLTKQMLSSMPTPQLGSFNPNVSESTNLNRSPEATTARISLDKAQQLNAQVAQMMRNNPGMSREQAANLINIPADLSQRRQTFVGPSRKLNTYEQKQADKYRYQANKQYALQNQDKGVTFNYNTGDLAFNNDQTAQSGDWGRVYPSALSQTIGSFTPQRYEDYTAPGGAGDVGAETFVNMNPLISGQILSASRLANLATNPTNNQYWSGDNTWWQNTLGGLGFLGDVTMAGMVRPGRPWGNMNQRFVPRGMNENFQFLNPRTGAPLSRTSSIVGSTQPQVPVRQMLNLTDDQLVLLEQEADDLAGGLSSETPGITSEQYMEQLKRDEIRKSMGDFLRENPVNTFDTDIIDPWFRNSSTKDFAGYVEGYMEELGLDSKNPADVEKFRSMFIKDELDRFNSEHKPTSSSFLESRIPGYEGGSLPPTDPIKDLTFRNPWKPDEIVYQVDPEIYNNFATAKDYQAALKHFTDYKRSWLMNRAIKPRNAAMDELKFNLSGGLRPFEWQRFTPDDLNFLASQVKGAAPFEGGRFPGTRNPSGNIRLNLNKGRPLNFEDEIKNALNQTPEEKQKIINTFRDYLNRPNSSNKYGGSTGYQKGGQIGKNYYIGKSKIQGDGVFAKRNIQPGEYIGKVHTIIEPYVKYQFEDLGRKHNHSERPNVQNVLIGNERHLFATKPIRKNQELTSNYRLQPDLEQPEGFAEKNKRKMEYGGVSKKSTGLIPEIPKLFKKEYGGPLKKFHQGKMTGPGIFQKGGDITKSSLPSSKKNSYIYNGGSLSFSKNKKVKIKLK